MGQVFDLHQHGARDLAVRAAEVHALDIGTRRADGGSDVGIEAAPVVSLERESDEEPLALRLLPIDFEPPLRLVCEEQEIWAIASMDAHAPTAGDISDDRVSWHWLAALGVANHQPVHPLDSHTLRAPHAIDEPLQRARLRRVGSGIEIRMEELENLKDVDVALTDGGEQMGRVRQVE